MYAEGSNSNEEGRSQPAEPSVPFAFSYDEAALQAEDAAIAEVAGVAPSSFDEASDEGLMYPGYAAYPDVEEDALSVFDAAHHEEDEEGVVSDPTEVQPVVVASEESMADASPALLQEATPEAASKADSTASAPASREEPEQEGSTPADRPKKEDRPHLRRAPKQANTPKTPFALSYKARAIISFVVIALITVGISMGMVALIWGQFFSTYAANNIESLAKQTANRIEVAYEKTLDLGGDTLTPAVELAGSSDELGVVVADMGGNTLYTSASGDSAKDNPSAATQIAIASVYYDGETIGSVRVWVYGSNALMSKVDREFLRDTYLALACAGGISLIIALVIGIIFARALVHPVNQVMKTARELSNGNLSARTGMQGTNELSRLGETIDDMADSFERDRKLEKQLTSDVAHELRTPLMAIQATVEAMIDGVYDRDDEHLMLVDAEVQRLSKLVGALLKLSRMEMRTQPMRKEVVDLTELADDVVVSHEAFIEDSGLTIHLDAQPNVKTIGDSDLIKQAIANLVSNAVRYTDEGGSITISVAREGRMAVIAVKDTGIGLTPEEEKMVFSRFWRADSGRAKESGGLGIGLALVKEIVDRHHGRVSVKGEKGVGSVFTLSFPLYDEEKSIAQARMAVRALERRQRGGFFADKR